MPRMARRVVCGFELVIATFSPTSALVSVDLPTFGRPTKETKPARNLAASLRDPSNARPLPLVLLNRRTFVESFLGVDERLVPLDEHCAELLAATLRALGQQNQAGD
jgi:hypothetical protein